MISYTQIYKILVLIVLAMKSNQVRAYLEVDPAMTPLGYSAVQAGAYSVFLGFYITSLFLAFLDAGKLAILALSACLLVFLYYPASLFISAIVAGLASDIPVSLTAFLVFSILALGMCLIQMKKVPTWLTLSRIDKRDCAVAVFLMFSLPTIWISGLFGDYTIAFLNYYATFLYVVFAVMLVSIWQRKALSLLLHLVFLWSILFMSLIVWFGYWQTGYWLTFVFHTVCAIAYLYAMFKNRQELLP
ncbi:hypothetical protein LF599_04920 [Pseudodesulfovibrio thermohalotolerans]|uniref:hypothetical protein n=1 Tax=Pseudodesulfovibrio thermohalotolerans TaxID=2880651 RepID=UPI002442E4DB|nr:hypothetical protein [Pseudodesulfovibrio thermohalotolerans]WFS63512.1 hypothetical protein LF599_04920 [Pseudodesulfovibrio thermohalotolerans]